ncbi:30S ribosomal protein S6 [Candidatus Giovannonibacteria bacterium]|nr:30S ribosomal protein S6 [Candidatus Giovannonibacteria bacterium]
MNSEPKLYEISLILKSDADESTGKVLENIKKTLETKNGRSADESRLTKKRLAYPINKWTEGSFISMKFFLKPEDLLDFSSVLNADKEIIRYMIASPTPQKDHRGTGKKIKRVSAEKKNADMKEIDKKLEEILGQ